MLQINDISGAGFLELSEEEVKGLFPKLGQRKDIQKLLEECQRQAAAVSG